MYEDFRAIRTSLSLRSFTTASLARDFTSWASFMSSLMTRFVTFVLALSRIMLTLPVLALSGGRILGWLRKKTASSPFPGRWQTTWTCSVSVKEVEKIASRTPNFGMKRSVAGVVWRRSRQKPNGRHVKRDNKRRVANKSPGVLDDLYIRQRIIMRSWVIYLGWVVFRGLWICRLCIQLIDVHVNEERNELIDKWRIMCNILWGQDKSRCASPWLSWLKGKFKEEKPEIPIIQLTTSQYTWIKKSESEKSDDEPLSNERNEPAGLENMYLISTYFMSHFFSK